MKLIVSLIIFLPFISFSQSEEVSKWQEENPNVVFISQDKFDELTESQKAVFKNNYIVFSESISITDIEKYEEQVVVQNKNYAATLFDYNDPNANFIKVWLGESGVYCVKSSVYETWSSLDFDQHKSVLVYEGEYLTIEDINNYESN